MRAGLGPGTRTIRMATRLLTYGMRCYSETVFWIFNNSDLEIKSETHLATREILGGEWRLISKPWEIRRDRMLDILIKAQPFTFKPVVQINPANNTLPLSQALNRRFHEKVLAEKKNYHVVNALTLLLARLEL